MWYEGTGTTDRRFLHADERGSIVATSDGTGAVTTTSAYDEYGIPRSTDTGRFRYTGQTWLPELGMYYYKARIYSPTLGRFLQTDPIRYGDGMNMYAYVGANPVNRSDPTGLRTQCWTIPRPNPPGNSTAAGQDEIVITATLPGLFQCVDIPDGPGTPAGPSGPTPSTGGSSGGSQPNPCPPPGTPFPSAEAAGAAGGKWVAEQQRLAGDNLERSWTTYPMGNGSWTFRQCFPIGTEEDTPICSSKDGSGAGHTHNPGGGSVLSSSNGRFDRPRDIENIKQLLNQVNNPAKFQTYLRDENGNIKMWTGYNLTGTPKTIGNDKCK